MRAQSRLRVLYDPLSYMVDTESAASSLPPRLRSVLNAAVIHQHALAPADPSADTPAQTLCAERIVRHWACVPAAAYLLACSIWRKPLANSRLWVALEPQVHTFNRFDFPTRPLPTEELPRSSAELLHWGGHFVATRLPDVPAWLGRRLQLRFRPLRHAVLPAALPSDATCLSMALAYAQKDPRFCRRVRT